MESPRPTEGHRRLEKLIGQWEGEERVHPTPWSPGGIARGRVANRLALDGFAVVQDYHHEGPDGTRFEGHAVFRWDSETGDYVCHWFDSFGGAPSEFRGEFDGDVLVLTSRGAQGFTRARFDLSETDRYGYRMDVSPDGESWVPFLEGTYRRSG